MRMSRPIGVGALLLAVACTKGRDAPEKDRAPPAPETSASVQSRWDEMVPKPEEPRRLPASWTDPKVVAALAKRCDYAPARELPGNVGDLTPNRFLCRKGIGSSVAQGPDAGRDLCRPYQSACEEKCKGGCLSCDTACVDACKTCVQPCSEDAGECKQGCATKCAECKEACTTKWETCNAADCAKEHDACTARLRALWEKNDCEKRCATFRACTGPKCETAVAPALSACLDKCAYIASPEHEMCEVKCYESAPCAPALCANPP